MFDCCQVFNEMDLLELRFNILDPYVEKFIVVESDRTHQGELKQLNFPSNKKRFSKFLPKIVYIVFGGVELSYYINSWLNENAQRNSILEALWHVKPSDGLLFVSDADEIPNPEKLMEAAELCRTTKKPVSLQMLHCMYYMNMVGDEPFFGPYMYDINWTADPAIDPNWSEDPTNVRFYIQSERRANYATLENAGWHFTALGGVDKIREKIAAYAHREFNVDQVTSEQHLIECIEQGIPYYETLCNFGKIVRFKKEDIACLPQYVKDNLDKFEKYILK